MTFLQSIPHRTSQLHITWNIIADCHAKTTRSSQCRRTGWYGTSPLQSWQWVTSYDPWPM